MAKQKKTIDEKIEELAVITQRGFSDLRKEMTDGFADVRSEMATKTDVKEITNRLDRIEFYQNTHDRRLDNVEDKVAVINVKLGIRK